MYTTYSVVVTWRRDRGGTWRVEWGLLILVTILLSLWTLCLVKGKTKYFWFITWPHNWIVMWLNGWIFLILSHHPTKFGVHRPCESGDITFWFATWARVLCVTWLCRWSPLVLQHHPANFKVHRPCESGDITFFIYHVTMISKRHVTLWVGSPHPKSQLC